MVPEGWEERPLDDLTAQSVTYGVVKPGDERTGGVPFVRGGDFPDGKIRIDDLRTISQDISNGYKRTVLRGGEILVSLVGYPGATAVVPDELAGANIARQAALVRPNRKVERDYLFQFLRSPLGQKRMLAQSLGSAQQVINLKDLKSVAVVTPPLPEQRKIADILSTWDRAIETTEALLATARTQKRALMQQLLTGQRRFPEFEADPWKEVRLGELGKCVRGVSYKPEQVELSETSLTMRLYRSTNIQEGEIIEDPFVLVPRSIVSGERVLQFGDLAVCMSNGSKALVGKSAPIRSTDENHTVGAFCAIFRPRPTELRDFVRFLFQSPTFDRHISLALAGSSINNLKNSDIEGMRLMVPTNEGEMTKVAAVLNKTDKEIGALIEQIIGLRTEKRALTQQLLTGMRRVVVDA